MVSLDPIHFFIGSNLLNNFFYFHNLSDSRCLYHANMALVGSAKCHRNSFLHNIDILGQRPVTSWNKMKRIMSNKYAHVYYQSQLVDIHC